MRRLLLTMVVLSGVSGAQAQDTTGTASSAASASMAQLLSQGYEIKTAVPNGKKFIVFLQKDKSAYACEFSSLTTSRCGSIN